MRRGQLLTVVILGAALGFSAAAQADVRLPHVFGKHMVLQREKPLPVWGWADPGEEVTVKIAEQEVKTTATLKGEWKLSLKPLAAGGPLVMTVAGKNKIELADVLVGEVWLCSGQSNMEMGIRSVNDGEKEIAAADYPQIRLLWVPRRTGAKAFNDIDASWKVCTPENISSYGWWKSGFSAAGYFFGRELHQKLKVPVGLIDASWGGTRIEPWTPPEGFAAVPALNKIVETIRQATPKYEKALAEALTAYEAWLPKARQALEAKRDVPAPPAWPKHQLDNNAEPTGIYNGMIHALIPFAMRGAIWYQGESNNPDGMLYTEMMKALIGGWRQLWGQGDFPFYYVQIAPLQVIYERDNLPKLWEAQTAAMAIPNTGMVVISDIGDLVDIHPKNKQDVGKRLAAWALAKTYGDSSIVYCGPIYKEMAVENGKIRIKFDYAAPGLASRNGKPLDWFTIAGEDKKFVSAKAEIDSDSVVVSSDEVKAPVAVRFAWDMKATPNLMNKAGLPASPFRTDKW